MTRRPGTRRGSRAALIPALPRAAWTVLGGDFVSAVGSGLTLPCLFLYAHQVRHLSDGAAGLVVATIAVASLAGNPLGGAAADRHTPRRALMAGLAIAAAGSVALALATTAAALFAAAALTGLGVSMVWPAQDALLASVAGPQARSAVFAVRHACLNAGLGLGALGAAAVISTARPGTFTVVYLADAATFLAFIPVLARLRTALPPSPATPEPGPSTGPAPASPPRARYRDVIKDRAFLRVWALTAVLVTVSFGQSQSSFPGYAARPGGISPHALAVAYAVNTVVVVAAQLPVLRWMAGRRRTTGAALAAACWAASWVVVLAAGHLGNAAALVAFAAAMAIFAVGECLISPTLPAIINDLASPEAAGRYNGLGVLAFTTGFLLGPIGGGAALGAGWSTGLFATLAAACAAASLAAHRLAGRLPAAANQVPPAQPDDYSAGHVRQGDPQPYVLQPSSP